MITLLLALNLFTAPITPTDLPHFVNWEWRIVDDATRIQVAYPFTKRYPALYVAMALAIIGYEQPPTGLMPDNNASGMSPFGERYPWQWSRYWKMSKVMPDGYFNCYENATGNLIPFFHFKYFSDCFKVLMVVVVNRMMFNGTNYQARWVGRGNSNPRVDELREEYLTKLLEYENYSYITTDSTVVAVKKPRMDIISKIIKAFRDL